MLKKKVNGQEFICTAEEEAEILASWVALTAEQKPRPKLVDAILRDPEQLAALKAALAK